MAFFYIDFHLREWKSKRNKERKSGMHINYIYIYMYVFEGRLKNSYGDIISVIGNLFYQWDPSTVTPMK